MKARLLLSSFLTVAISLCTIGCGDDKPGNGQSGENGGSGGTSEKDAKVKNMMVLKDYVLGALNASAGGGGKFPASLEELRKVADIPADHLLIDPSSGDKVDPLYFPGLSESSPGESILIACPFQYSDGTRGIANLTGQAIRIPEEEYKEKIAAQQQ